MRYSGEQLDPTGNRTGEIPLQTGFPATDDPAGEQHAEGPQTSQPQTESGGEPTGEGQREESFVLRLLVDADGVRSTSIRAVRGQAEARWPSWRPAELVTFVESQLTGLTRPPMSQDRTGATVAIPQITPTHLDLLAEVRPSSPTAGSPFDVRLFLHVGERPSPHRSDQLEFRAVARVSPLTRSMPHSGAACSSAEISVGQEMPSPLRARGTVSGAATSIHLADPGRPAGRYQVDAVVTVHIPGVRRPVGLAGIVPLHFDIFES